MDVIQKTAEEPPQKMVRSDGCKVCGSHKSANKRDSATGFWYCRVCFEVRPDLAAEPKDVQTLVQTLVIPTHRISRKTPESDISVRVQDSLSNSTREHAQTLVPWRPDQKGRRPHRDCVECTRSEKKQSACEFYCGRYCKGFCVTKTLASAEIDRDVQPEWKCGVLCAAMAPG